MSTPGHVARGYCIAQIDAHTMKVVAPDVVCREEIRFLLGARSVAQASLRMRRYGNLGSRRSQPCGAEYVRMAGEERLLADRMAL
jgi:hypothetical protein